MNDQALEQEIKDKGLTAPRITPADLQANIASEHYFTAIDGVLGAYKNNDDVRIEVISPDWEVPRSIESLGLLTFCVLVLRNGFTVAGESACASPENFNAEIGRKIARANAEQKIWPLMGYELKERLHQSTLPAQAPTESADCPHAAPLRYCPECVENPCPIGLGGKAQ